MSLEECFGDNSVRVIAEPGRGMCGDTVSLITSVIGKSVRGDRTWYIIDEGMYGAFSGQVIDHVLGRKGARRLTSSHSIPQWMNCRR